MTKTFITIVCVLWCTASQAQHASGLHTDAQKLIATHTCAVAGYVRDNRNIPVSRVEAFLYSKDSSIVASGYTDATGHFETNAVPPGNYWVKLVYPAEASIVVNGLVMKPGITPLNLRTALPEIDTSMYYTEVMPKAANKIGTK